MDLDLGTRLIPYLEGWDAQRRLHAQVVSGERPSTLLMVEHESAYTVGRRAHSWERPASDVVEPGHVPVIDVDRGGKTTWHGPGQLTAYPILRLVSPVDVIRYVRALEAAVIDVCALYRIQAFRVEGRSGVWAAAPAGSPHAQAKVCALGVRVSRGVTMHGIGLNVDPDLHAFDLDRIIPCGITDAGVTSLSQLTSTRLAVADLADPVAQALERHLAPLTADVT